MATDFHNKPFDEGTLVKLEIFQLYAREWLPVFLSSINPPKPEVHVFDFFAGPGVDSNNVEGSPLRIINEAIGKRYYVGGFSINKGGPRIYGVVFGSAHPLGMDKFLDQAWRKDCITGEANFDIDKEDFREDAPFLEMELFEKPTKVKAFEAVLRTEILSGRCDNERACMELCFQNGMRRQHAKPVLKNLKQERKIHCEFDVPQFGRKPPRPIQLLPE